MMQAVRLSHPRLPSAIASIRRHAWHGLWKAAAAACVAPVFILLSGCGRGTDSARAGAHTVIAISGSDTMVNVAQMWAEEYGRKKPSVKVEVSGGGSGVGIRDLMQGVVRVANSSRDLTQAEREQITARAGRAPIETVVGFDGIAIYVHKDNPLESITMEQLERIFGEGGDITRWSQLGVDMGRLKAPDKIIRVSRQNSSGTYLYFRAHVLKNRDFKMGSCDMSGSKEAVELVASTRTAIGYSGMGYATKDVKMLRVGTRENPAGFAPSQANVTGKLYPLSRALLMITAGAPDGETRGYMDWTLTSDGQAIVAGAGYVPVSPVK